MTWNFYRNCSWIKTWVFAYLENMSDFTKNVEILERFLRFLDVTSPHHFLFQAKNFEFFSKSRYVDISHTILLRSCYSQLLKSQMKLRTNQNKTWILYANLSQELLGTNSRIENHLFRQKMFTSNIFSRLTNLLIVVRTKFILYKCLLSVINI